MSDHPRIDRGAGAMDRRRILRLGALGLGAAALGLPVAASGQTSAEAVLLSCVDYRFVTLAESYMEGRKLRDKYYHIALAGAALAAVKGASPAWPTTFWEHLAVIIKLMHPKLPRVVVIDHRDCGAYREILGQDCCTPSDKETAVHTEQLKELRKQIGEKHPKLQVELGLMNRDGKVLTIT